MEKVLTVIATTTDADKLRAMDANTKRIHGETHVIRSAIAARLLFLCGPNGIVGNEFEEVRQALIKVQGSDGRMSILLKKSGGDWRYRASDALPRMSPTAHFAASPRRACQALRRLSAAIRNSSPLRLLLRHASGWVMHRNC